MAASCGLDLRSTSAKRNGRDRKADPLTAVWLVVGLVIGLAVGGGAAFAIRLGRDHAAPIESADGALAPGVGQVLIVLRSLAVVVDNSDTVVRASPAAYAFGIVRARDLVAQDLLELVRQVRRDGRIRQVELELPRGPIGDATFPVSVRVAPLGIDHVLVLIEDQTHLKRLDAVRRDFVANVSHELKTPVGALSLLAEAVQHAAGDPAAVERFAGRMQHESHRLGQLVQELIDLSRLESKDPLREPEVISIDDVVAAATDRTRDLAVNKRIRLEVAGEAGLKMYGDQAQLVTALRNLIENAINYSPESTGVNVEVRRVGALAEIAVIDQGIGISAAAQERIFERFYRVDPSRSRMTGGTGLGLSIVKHVAGNHGGDVRVSSREGAGSTFTLRLPLLRPNYDGVSSPIATSRLEPM
jgi:two-component system sensor histidine kinase SenX3